MKAQAPPTKGVAPVTTGVRGQLVDAAPEGVLFGSKRWKQSPYDPLLLQLKAAGAGKFLRFDDLRARAAVTYRAKKLGLKVLFGEQGSILWVTLEKAELHLNGISEDAKAALSNAELVIKAIEAKRHTSGEIVSWMRSNGASGVGITQIDGLISGLARSGRIKMKPLRPGDDQPERWVLA